MTVRELIDKLSEFAMDAKVDVLINISNKWLKENIGIEKGEIFDYFDISGVGFSTTVSRKKEADIIVEV